MNLIDIPRVGEKTLATLTSHNITTIDELIRYYPRTHREYLFKSTNSINPGDWVILIGTISRPISRHTTHTTTQFATFRPACADRETPERGGGQLTLRWFNSPFITRSVSPSATYQVKGKIEVFNNTYQIVNPELKILHTDHSTLNTEILPIYTPLGTLKSGHLRNLIKGALAIFEINDPLSLEIQAKFNLIDLPTALFHIHFPPTLEDLEAAKHRLGFDELYDLQLQAESNRELTKVKTDPLHIDTDLLNRWIADLPFSPTTSQSTAITEITADLSRPIAMHRLLQGEVGSGKTIVAAASALAAHSSGHQTLILAPTQILAEQLYAAITELLPTTITTSLLTSSSKGDTLANIVVGTQALLQKNLLFGKIGLVIIDEQHRFGVEQRLLLTKLHPAPHFLMMTATPIPRTLAMSLFAGLDISYLHELPKNRLPIKTFYVSELKRRSAYDWVKQEITTNDNRAFVVSPLIDIALDEEGNEKKSLQSLELELKTNFPNMQIDIMHGRMKANEKTEHLRAFRDGMTHILVATSMIEVGIDIPTANIIVIEDAERFGLSQLHQLRGRVGRGGKQGYCLVVSKSTTGKAKERLAYFVKESSGEKLAEYDLQSRGAGELYGTAQHGFFKLRFASLSDESLLRQTLEAVKITHI